MALEKKNTQSKSSSPDCDKDSEDIEDGGMVDGGSQGEEKDGGLLVDKRGAQYMSECVYEGIEYRIGDVVYVKAR